MNIALLLFAFLLGQGGLFLVQTWLIANGEIEFVGKFGLSFSMITIAYFVIDWGGSIELARSQLARSSDDNFSDFLNYCIARIIIAGLVIPAYILSYTIFGDQFSSSYITTAALGLTIATCNANGVLDGMRRSGLAGLTTTFPIMTSTAAIPLSLDVPLDNRGSVLGYAYTIGIIVAVLTQYVVMYRNGTRVTQANISRRGILAAITEGGLIIATQLPGQLFYRVQLATAAWLLGPAATGIVAYAKQISSAALQVIGFIRRAEFPQLIDTLSHSERLKDALRVQKTGILIGAVIGAALSAAGILVSYLRSDHLGDAALITAAFGPIILTGATYGAITQILLGQRRFRSAAALGNLVIAIGAILTLLLVHAAGSFGIPVAEFLMQVIGVALFVRLLRSAR